MMSILKSRVLVPLIAFYLQFTALLILILAGMAVCVAAIYYWINLSFVFTDGVRHPAPVPDSIGGTTLIIWKDIFLLVLCFMGIRISWIGVTKCFPFVQRSSKMLLLYAIYTDETLVEAQRTDAFTRLMASLEVDLIQPHDALPDGTQQVISLLEALKNYQGK